MLITAFIFRFCVPLLCFAFIRNPHGHERAPKEDIPQVNTSQELTK